MTEPAAQPTESAEPTGTARTARTAGTAEPAAAHEAGPACDPSDGATAERTLIGPAGDPVAALAEQHAELAALLADLGPGDWGRSSPCDGWDVADVVLHLAQTDEMAASSLRGRFDEVIGRLTADLPPAGSVDDGAGLMVTHQRDIGPEAIHARWLAASADLRAAIDATDLHARVTWVAGQLAARTLVTTRLAETWIHTGDVGEALGVPIAATDRLWHIARLAWRTLPYAFAGDGRSLTGPVVFDLRGPTGDRWLFAETSGGIGTDTGGDGSTVDRITTVTGDAVDLCRVAARRADPAGTSLVAVGPDAGRVLRLVRTYA